MDLYEIRKKRSREECRLVEKCAELALSGYEALCAAVQNNVTESKLVSELDYAMKKQGAEETLTTLNCGFLNDANGMGLLHSAANSQKAVKYGDCIAAAITPRYNGYWVQMLRTLCVRGLMQNEKLDVLLTIGNGCVGTNAYGCFRFLTAANVYYGLQSALFFPCSNPVGIVDSEISCGELKMLES